MSQELQEIKKEGGGQESAASTEIRYYKKKRRKMLVRRAVTITVLVLVLAVCTLLSPIFQIRSIYVEGINYISKDQILNASGLVTGKNTFLYNMHSVTKNISTLPFVDKVSIHRSLPGTVTVSVVENVPVANITFLDSNLTIDKKGKILEINSVEEETPFPSIIGLDVTDLTLGKRVGVADEGKLKRTLLVLDELSSQGLLDRLSSLDMTYTDAVSLKMGDIDVIVGDDTQMSYKMKYLSAILETLGSSDKGQIDLTTIPNVVFKAS